MLVNDAVPVVPLALVMVVPARLPPPLELELTVIPAVEFDTTFPNWSTTWITGAGEKATPATCVEAADVIKTSREAKLGTTTKGALTAGVTHVPGAIACNVLTPAVWMVRSSKTAL